MFDFDTPSLLKAFGLTFAGIGVAARLGLWKQWYWRSKGMVYAYLPLGVIFLLYGYEALAKERLGASFWIYQASYVVPLILGAWWVVRTPAFVKPDWVRWVEDCPESTRQAMRQAAQDDPRWEEHVASREKVEAWARSLERAKPRANAAARK